MLPKKFKEALFKAYVKKITILTFKSTNVDLD